MKYIRLTLVYFSLFAAIALGHSLPSEEKNEFHFIVLGDSQFDDPAAFNRIIDQTKLLRPAFVIQVGDLIEGYNNNIEDIKSEWLRFKKQIQPLSPIAFLAVPGNHDVYNGNRRVDRRLESLYENHWGDLFKTFTYKNSQFFLINTDSIEAQNAIGPTQMSWLRAQLKNSNATHKLVFMHKPALLLKNSDLVHELFLKQKVSHVFYGHHHHYHHIEKDGIHYSMTNAAANLAHEKAEAGGFRQLIQVSVRGEEISIAVIEADSVQAQESVSAKDNYDLYALGRGFTKKTVTLNPLKKPNHFEFNIELNNTTKRTLNLNISCHSQDNRWLFTPKKIQTISLLPRSQHLLRIETHYEPTRQPESFPECGLKAPFQTGDGQWIEFTQLIKGKRRS